jgi:hypothetical protein
MAIFGVVFTSIFRIVADLFMFAGLVMLRFLVMFFPAVAVLGVMAPMSAIVHRVANMAGASVVNVVAFAAGAAVHTTVVSALLSRSQPGGMSLLVLVLCLVSTLAAFVFLFPLLSLTNVVGMSSGGHGARGLRTAGRLAGRYALSKKAATGGARDGDLVGSSGTGEKHGAADPYSMGGGHHRLRRIHVPEGFSRPDRPEPRDLPAESEADRRRLPAGALSAGSSVSDSHRRQSPGDSILDRNLVPLEGVVVHHPPSFMPEATVVHDSETIIRRDSIGPRLFDPALRSSVPVDHHGNVFDEGREA